MKISNNYEIMYNRVQQLLTQEKGIIQNFPQNHHAFKSLQHNSCFVNVLLFEKQKLIWDYKKISNKKAAYVVAHCVT